MLTPTYGSEMPDSVGVFVGTSVYVGTFVGVSVECLITHLSLPRHYHRYWVRVYQAACVVLASTFVLYCTALPYGTTVVAVVATCCIQYIYVAPLPIGVRLHHASSANPMEAAFVAGTFPRYSERWLESLYTQGSRIRVLDIFVPKSFTLRNLGYCA